MSFAAVLERLQTVENPFPGLRHFGTAEAHLYYGRDPQIAELANRLNLHRFLAVVGVSGSGKSSLVLAGLVPALRLRANWRVFEMRPKADPFSELAGALQVDATELRASSFGLIKTVANNHDRVLLVVDQFEELFRFKDQRGLSPEERSQRAADSSDFVQLLLKTSSESRNIVVVVTMRSDYLGSCAEFRNLPEALNGAQYLVPRLTREQLREAIEGPLGRVRMTPSLVQRLLNDAGDDPGSLPILQHTLMRTWSRWRRHSLGADRPIDLNDYEAVGCMKAALDQHADELLEGLPEDIVRIVFQRLTVRGVDQRERRDPATSAELCALCQSERALEVIDRFRQGEASFLTPRDGYLTPDTYVDLTHESLLWNWTKLKTWINQEEQFANMFLALVERAKRYKPGEGPYLTGLDLSDAIDWRETRNQSEAWAVHYADKSAFSLVQSFIADSEKNQKDVEIRETAARNRKLVLQKKLTFLAILAFAVLAVIMLSQLLSLALSRYHQSVLRHSPPDVPPLIISNGPLNAEVGAFALQNYSPKTYGANPQNWAIAQDSRGVMYFGNNEGVLEFDGVSWRLIKLSDGSPVRSLAVDTLGRVYVGGRGVFGYLQPDAHGRMGFAPIEVPNDALDFLDVWNVVPTPAGVYFSTDYKIFFRSHDGQIKVFRAKKRFGRTFSAYGEIFTSDVDSGLRRLSGDDFVAGPAGDSIFASARLVFAPGEHPLLASSKGVFNFSLSEITPFPNSAAAYLAQNQVFSIKQLSNGTIAVGTKKGGLVLLNQRGALERIVTKRNGLASDWVTAIYEDRQRAIWLATDGGLTRFVTGLSTFGEAQGIHGSILSEARHAGALYVGTISGVFRMHSSPGVEPTFEPVKDINNTVYVLKRHNGKLFAGSERGVYLISGDKAEKVSGSDGPIYDLFSSKRTPEVLYTAGDDGVRRLQRKGLKWKWTEPIVFEGQRFVSVVEGPNGTVWATTNFWAWRLDFSAETVRAQQFTEFDGIAAGSKNVFLLRGNVVLATTNGLLRLSEAEGRFLPDEELGSKYADGSKAVSLVREDADGNVWITGEGYHDFLKQIAGGFRAFASPFSEIGANELYSVLLDSDGTCWASGESGKLYRMEKLRKQEKLPLLLRRVAVIGQKDPLYEGDSPIGGPPSLPYRDNDLRFEFAAPTYDTPGATEFQFQLEGNDKNVSNWANEPHAEYRNLFEGSYRFHVWARDPHGVESDEVVFPFEIQPPFYRTWWAYGVYGLVSLLAGWLILRWLLI